MTEICLFSITAKSQTVIFITFCFIHTVHELLDHPSYMYLLHRNCEQNVLKKCDKEQSTYQNLFKAFHCGMRFTLDMMIQQH